MPGPLTEHEREAFLAGPRVGVLSVAGDDGRPPLTVAADDGRPPLTVPIWYGYRPGGTISFFTGTQGRRARKTRLIEKAGVLSLCVQRAEVPYKYVTVEGTIVGADRPSFAEHMLAVARRYLPEEAAQQFVAAELEDPGPELVLFTIRPDRWLSFDFGDEAG